MDPVLKEVVTALQLMARLDMLRSDNYWTVTFANYRGDGNSPTEAAQSLLAKIKADAAELERFKLGAFCANLEGDTNVLAINPERLLDRSPLPPGGSTTQNEH